MSGAEAVATGFGVALFIGGVVLLSLARRGGRRVWPIVGGVSRATESAAGLAMCFAGYHVVAYGGPPGWITFRVPEQLGWMVFVGSGVAVVGAVAADRVLPEESGGD
ncbi:MAG: hypothetical protein AAFR96_05965 [Planctomycetota bacterium]